MGHKCSDELKMELTGEVVHFIPVGGVLDTSDATAAAYDMAAPKTAYANGEKITGTLQEVPYDETEAAKILTTGDYAKVQKSGDYIVSLGRYLSAKIGDNTKGVILRPGAILGARMPAEMFGDATSEDVAAGKTFTSANGVKLSGTMPVKKSIVRECDTPGLYIGSDGLKGVLTDFIQDERAVIEAGANVSIVTPYGEFGTATAEDVTAGKTFTSAAGLLVEGTGSGGGLITASGEGDSIVIATTANVSAIGDDIILGG